MNSDLPESLSTPEPSINLGLIYSLLLRRSWIIALCLLGTLLLALLYVLIATPRYESTSVIEVQKEEQLVYTPNDTNEKNIDAAGDDTQLKTIEQALQLDGLYEEVANSPALKGNKDFIAGLKFKDPEPPTISAIAKRMKAYTTIKLVHGTRLISIAFDHPDAAIAQLVTSTIVSTFINEYGRSQTDTEKSAMTFLQGESARFKEDLQKAQDALQVYSEALLLKDQISDQQKVVLDLLQRYRAKHPRLIQAKSELAELENKFEANIRNVVVNYPPEASYWNANLRDTANSTLEDRVDSQLKLVEARTNVLQQEGNTQSTLTDNVMKQTLETDIGKEVAPVAIDVVQPADLPTLPAKPQKVLIFALAGLGGIAIGLLTVFGSHSLDSSLKSVTEVEQAFNLPVLGSFPKIKGTESERGANGKRAAGKKAASKSMSLSFHRNLVLLSDPEGNAAENFRSLRAAIELLGKAQDHRVVLFSSAITNEGKTFTSCNYAVSLAQQGLKTLLIDADLRCPAVHERFELPEKTMGLIEHVSLGVEWDDVIQRHVIENLDILLPGVKSPNPAEFLHGDGLKDVIKNALLKYDRVVLDSPPINAVSDTLLIAPYVQAICLVVRSKMTPRGAVERALSLLQRAKVRPVGIVLNYISTDWKSPYAMPKYYYADNRYGQAYVKQAK